MTLITIAIWLLLGLGFLVGHVVCVLQAVRRRRPEVRLFDAPFHFPPTLLFVPDRLREAALPYRKWAFLLLAACAVSWGLSILGFVTNHFVAH